MNGPETTEARPPQQPEERQPEIPQPAEQPEPPGATRYRVKIVHSSATEVYQADRGLGLARGDFVIVPTRYGAELGRIQGQLAEAGRAAGEHEDTIERKASREEVERCQACAAREQNAFQVCRAKIAEHGLDMKLVSAHYLAGEPKILFYFTAEARVDFRELVKDLVGIFKMRIELRQIGVRDEARVVGGMGVCGRTYCCHGVTDKLKAVSIKMAKEQNLTLNSMKISGPCGRLLCCLAYEYDTYRECRRGLPSEGARLRAGGQTLKVLDVNIFTRTLKLAGEDGETVTLAFEALSWDAQAGQWQVREGPKPAE
jgi:cell fate regulator YaaT (PSP1 superfamily)